MDQYALSRAARKGWRQSRSERLSAAMLVVALHAATLALLMFSRAAVATSPGPSVIAFNVTDSSERQSRPQPSRVHVRPVAAPLPAADGPLAQMAVVSPIADTSADPQAMSDACDLTQPVQDALRHDDAVMRQMPGIPADARSVANAIVVWNAGWIEPVDAPAKAAVAAIRRTIMQTVAASSGACRNQHQFGPRLIYLPAGSDQPMTNSARVTVLALGSGQWSWQQLADGDQPLPAASPASLAAAPATIPSSEQRAVAATDQTSALKTMLATLLRKPSTAGLPYYP